MATQTPNRDNTRGEPDVKPVHTNEHLSSGFDPEVNSNQAGTSSGGLPPNSTGSGSSSYSSGNSWGNIGASGDSTSRDGLRDQEANPDSGASTALGDDEKSLAGRSGSADSPTHSGSWAFRLDDDGRALKLPGNRSLNLPGLKFNLRFSRRNVATWAIIGLVGGGGIYGISILQGPMQLVHLSQILQKNDFGNEKSMAARLKGYWRYHKTGDIGETRVGKLGSRTFSKVTQQLADIGVEFERNRFTGHPTRLNIDPSKHPATRGLPSSQQAEALDKLYGVERGAFARAGSGVISVDIDPTTAKGIKLAASLVDSSLKNLDNGAITSAQNKRVVKKFFNLPNLFSPISKRTQAVQNRAGQAAATKEEKRKADEERRKALRDPVAQRAAGARGTIKDKVGGATGFLQGALITTGGLCLVRAISDDVVAINRAEIVSGAAIEAVDKTAAGSQTQSGQNFVIDQLGTYVQGFTDENGKTIFGSRALQETAGKKNPTGPELRDDYKQAFSNETTAQNIKESIGSPNVLGVDLGGVACSTPGLIFQGAGSIALLAFGPITGGTTWAAFAGKAAVGTASSAAIFYLLQTHLPKIMSDDTILPPTLSGPLGGDLLAYGGREVSNIAGRSAGGIELSNAESAALDMEERIASRQEFQNKSFASRIFDVSDHRSLASGMIDSTNPDPGQNLQNVASGFLNLWKLVPNLFSTLLPKVAAADPPYDWGFNRYGIPASILEKKEYEDPYENEKKVGAVFNSGDTKYIDKARKCFGVAISKGPDGWEATPQEDVNPNGEEYVKADCNDISDPNWVRVFLWVLDDRVIVAVACYDGNQAACDEIGAGGASGGGGGGSSNISGNAKELAQELIDSGKVTGDPRYMGQIEQIAKGDFSCNVNPSILKILVGGVRKGHTFFITSLNRYCTGVLTPGSGTSSYHYADGGGHAVDIGTINGMTSTGRSPKDVDFLKDVFEFMPKESGIGQIGCPSQPLSLPSGITEFQDECDHVHIQVPKEQVK